MFEIEAIEIVASNDKETWTLMNIFLHIGLEKCSPSKWDLVVFSFTDSCLSQLLISWIHFLQVLIYFYFTAEEFETFSCKSQVVQRLLSGTVYWICKIPNSLIAVFLSHNVLYMGNFKGAITRWFIMHAHYSSLEILLLLIKLVL